MSGFSPDWLALREPADHRARNRDVAGALAGYFGSRAAVRVVDLGCGTGSNLRATMELLPVEQHWTLVDYDEHLLAAARDRLRTWAETAAEQNGQLLLTKGVKRLTVALRRADLASDLEAVLVGADLVTAAAFFDLASPQFIERTANAVAANRATFYTVLTFNGIQRWTPRRPADNAMSAAFNSHQMSDKGFGAAAGPQAAAYLADHFRLAAYAVVEGESPWELGPSDASLIRELADGYANAVAETRQVDAKTIADWRKVSRTAAWVGHTDTLATPPS